MLAIDYYILIGFLLGMLVVGGFFANRIKNTKDMFSAGGQSPWWVSGLSSFMTMFSAGTFVVWGGIAYQNGLVSVTINMAIGIAAIFVGLFIAHRWQRMGLSTVAEYVAIRFSYKTVNIYTWIHGTISIFGLGTCLYAFSRIFCAMVPLEGSHILADSQTGNLSIPYTSVFIGLIVIAYAVAGGLWAVLMTDVLQFIVLSTSVAIVVPLAIARVGGLGEFVTKAPENFFKPVAADYTWLFIIGWIIVFIFKAGGEWQFAQRYICVPTSRDARKSAFLFAVLYLISPIFMMLPPMIYRTINPNAHHEEAYILMCKHVLPAGMLGLIIAAMFSATASLISSFLNVFAAVLTRDFYYKFFKPDASETHLVWMGRMITFLLGLFMILGALIIPRWGITRYIIAIASLLTGPLVLPIIWGLFSRHVNEKAVWACLIANGIATLLIFLVRTDFFQNSFLANFAFVSSIVGVICTKRMIVDLAIGAGLPLIVLVIMEVLFRKEVNSGWVKIQERLKQQLEIGENIQASTIPAKMTGYGVLILAVVMGILGARKEEGWIVLVVFSLILLMISLLVFISCRINYKKNAQKNI